MDKRYQVFVSSTYEDLQLERQEVMHALLELDCMPAGMELFPAANEDQWTQIKQVIDDCDYYIVIVGGRYGSVDGEGMSYTEKEYRYAVESGKPVIGFLHKSPENLQAKHTEQSEDGKKRLEAFREHVRGKPCQLWETPADLGSKVSRSLIKLIKKHPAVGWVRADNLPSDDVNKELLGLRKQVDQLQQQLEQARTEAPEGSEELAQGEDNFETKFTYIAVRRGLAIDIIEESESTERARLTWNEIFSCVSPLMIDEANNDHLQDELSSCIAERVRDTLEEQTGRRIEELRISSESFLTIIVQLRALGLITKSLRNRSIKDTNTYWTLTPYGEGVMNRLRAIRKTV